MNISFGTDGIRGPVESFITPEVCLKLGHAIGKVFRDTGTNTVLIGKDTRVSGYMLESALQAGFIAAGVNVRFIRTFTYAWSCLSYKVSERSIWYSYKCITQSLP